MLLTSPLAISVVEALGKARGILRDETALARPPSLVDSSASGNTFRFGRYELDLDAHGLRDDGKRQAVIRTVHGRGFMFVAERSRS